MTGPGTEARWRLVNRRDFLRRSLEDAEREHAAGDLADDDYRRLTRRDRRLLDEVEGQLAALAPEDPGALDGAGAPGPDGAGADAAAGRGRRRLVLALVGVGALVAGSVLLVLAVVSPRQPGGTLTGGIRQGASLTAAQQLAQAEQLVAAGDDSGALAEFGAVLRRYPDQPEALTEEGWLLYESGSQSGTASVTRAGRALLARAVATAPSYGPAHLYQGVVDQQSGDAAGAVAQFGAYLAGRPPAAQLRPFALIIRQAYAGAGRPVPPGVPASPAG